MNPEPSWDPLGYANDLALRETFYPLGFSLHIETNSPHVLASARLSWPRSDAAFPDPPLRLRVIVSGAGTNGGLRAAPVARAQNHLLTLVAGRDDFAACDMERGFAYVVVPEQTVHDSRHFRFYYLECLIYTLLTWHRLTAIHAGCVSDGKSAVLFCGKSGAGKSCLAYACARDGLQFVSDDAVYLIRNDPAGMLLGKPRWLRLKPSAVELFPELRAHTAALDVNGETVLELATTQISGLTTCESARGHRVVFLERQPEAAIPSVEQLRPEEALDLLVRELPLWDREVSREHTASIRKLVAAGAHRLTYSDLGQAVEEVKRLLGQA